MGATHNDFDRFMPKSGSEAPMYTQEE